jgi:hypothetical protein
MATRLDLCISAQPDGSSCGATCLQAVYGYWRDPLELAQVVAEVPQLEDGGTLAVLLGCHALRRGYRARINTYNLQLFDPTWFCAGPPVDLRAKLLAQKKVKQKRKLQFATDAFLDFLELGGEVRMEDLRPELLREHLERGRPIVTGLSATWLYRCAREVTAPGGHDDVRGLSVGHFVVLCGYEAEERRVLVADPLYPNPFSEAQIYTVDVDRLVSAILLGILTYDANLLVITPPRPRGERADESADVDPDRRQQP